MTKRGSNRLASIKLSEVLGWKKTNFALQLGKTSLEVVERGKLGVFRYSKVQILVV